MLPGVVIMPPGVVHIPPVPPGVACVLPLRLATSEPLTVVSGLAKHIPMEELKGKKVVVVCNMKPVSMRGKLIC